MPSKDSRQADVTILLVDIGKRNSIKILLMEIAESIPSRSLTFSSF